MHPIRPSIRPPIPPKPKCVTVPSRDFSRDSGISVSDEPSPMVCQQPLVSSPVPGHSGGVRKLATRFETIALRHSSPFGPNSGAEDTPPPVRKPSSGQLFRQLQSKVESTLVGSPKAPQWHPRLGRRATAIAEKIYDTVCERDHPVPYDIVNDPGVPSIDPPYEESVEDPTSTDGYSSFESSTDDEEPTEGTTVPKPSRTHYYSLPSTREEPEASPPADHIRKVIDELLEKEQRYIETLDQGLRNYTPAMYSQTLPVALRGQRNVIFINLEEILRTHRDCLLPDLERAAKTVVGRQPSSDRIAEKIAEIFLDYIENDRFYCYVRYAMHQPESEMLRMRYNDYFLKIQHDLDDRLGLNSLLLQPIQRLPRYKLLLNEMVKDLLRDGVDGKRTMNRRTALLCKVDKRISILIDRVNEAINLHDIRQCSGNTASAALRTHSPETPLTLILQPEGNRNPARDTPINLLYQGKFLRLFPVEMYDMNVRRKYSGKLFAFEKMLLYVEVLRDRLEYRGHFADSELCYLEEGRNRLIIYAGGARGTVEIILQSETNTELQPVLAILYAMTNAVIYDVVEGATGNHMSLLSFGNDDDDDELSSTDGAADNSTAESWDEQRLTESLLEAQQQFLEVLVANRRFYLDTLGVEVKQKLASFIDAFEAVMNLHRVILNDLSVSSANPDLVSRCFDRYLKTDVLDPYYDYLREFRKAMKWIQHNQTPSNFHNRVAATVEQFTFLCIAHLEEFSRYFDVLIVRYSEDSTLNIPIDKELFQRLAYVLVQLNAYRANLTLNYDLFLIDERVPAVCGLVCFNDRVTVIKPPRESDAGPCRLFVCERAAVCVKIQDVPEHGQQVERMAYVLFFDPFGGGGSPMRMRKSKRQPQRLNFIIDDVKFRIDFSTAPARNKLYSNYVNRYIML